MDCDKIQAYFSDYLDKTLKKDLNKTVKDHLLVCKKCSNAYFSMKSIVDELAGLEKIKAPDGFLISVNQAIESRSWHKNIFNIFPSFKIPMEFVTFATTAVLIFLIITNLKPGKNDGNTNLEPNPLQTASNNGSNQITSSSNPVSLDFYISNKNTSKHVSSDNIVTVDSGKPSGQTATNFFKEIDDVFPLLRKEKTISDINEIIFSMGGEIVSNDYQFDSAFPETIMVKIPFNNYESFIDRIEKVGSLKPKAPSFAENHTDFVFLKMRLNLTE